MMKKVFFHLYNLERGGAERVVTTLAECFAKENYEVYISTEEYGQDEYPISKSIERIHVGLTNEQQKGRRLSQYMSRILNLRKAIKDVRPDIVISFARKNNYRALAASMGTGIPVVISVRSNPQEDYVSLEDRIQVKLLFGRAAGCVFQTEEQKNFFAKKIQEKSRVIINPVNPQFLEQEFYGVRQKEVVHSGRLTQCKNQIMLLQAFSEIHESYPELKLKLFGKDTCDGTLEELQSYITENHAQDYIFIMGQSDDLPKDLMSGLFAVFTSDYEGMPNAMMETMALGLPTIATDCPAGGPRAIIDNEKDGLLIPVRDKEALKKAMLYLIENPELADTIGKNAADKVKKIGDTNAIFRQWKEYLESICNI